MTRYNRSRATAERMIESYGILSTHYPKASGGSGPGWNKDNRAGSSVSQTIKLVQMSPGPQTLNGDASPLRIRRNALIAAKDLTYEIKAGDRIAVGEVVYSVREVEAIAPDAAAIIYRVDLVS